MSLGLPELLIILVIVLVVFGPKRLPQLGRQVGGGLRELKTAIVRRHDEDGERPPAITAPRVSADDADTRPRA